jgi:hypothetical protein
LTQARRATTGQSSTTHGYTAGGFIPAGTFNTIDKFPFAVDSNATDVGDTTELAIGAADHSSSTHGYLSGFGPSNNSIDKFPFSTDTNATDVGDLTFRQEMLYQVNLQQHMDIQWRLYITTWN